MCNVKLVCFGAHMTAKDDSSDAAERALPARSDAGLSVTTDAAWRKLDESRDTTPVATYPQSAPVEAFVDGGMPVPVLHQHLPPVRAHDELCRRPSRELPLVHDAAAAAAAAAAAGIIEGCCEMCVTKRRR